MRRLSAWLCSVVVATLSLVRVANLCAASGPRAALITVVRQAREGQPAFGILNVADPKSFVELAAELAYPSISQVGRTCRFQLTLRQIGTGPMDDDSARDWALVLEALSDGTRCRVPLAPPLTIGRGGAVGALPPPQRLSAEWTPEAAGQYALHLSYRYTDLAHLAEADDREHTDPFSPQLLLQRRSTSVAWEESAHWGFDRGEARGVAVSDECDGLILSFSGENLLTDAGFESPAEKCEQMQDPYARKPDPTNGWEHNGLSGKDGAVREAPFAHSGKRAWELVDTVTPGEPALLQRVGFRPEYRGRTFVFSLWARTREGTNDQAIMALKFSTKGHWRADVARPLGIGPEWRQHSVTAVMPKDADELGVVIGPSSYEGQGAIIVDDAFLAAAVYGRSGVYTSAPRDMGDDQSVLWRVAQQAAVPQGTAVELWVRTGMRSKPDPSWSAWVKVDSNPDITLSTPKGRYLQYQFRLTSSRPDQTPIVQKVQFSYGAHLAFVTGRVVHARTGAPVAGAVVTFGTETTTTDRRGAYLLGVPAGQLCGAVNALHYLPVRVGSRSPDQDTNETSGHRSGFGQETQPERSLKEGQRVRLDFKLAPDPTWWTFRGNAQRQGYSALSGSLDGFGIAWQYPLGTVGGGQILPADVDGDGRSEFVIARGGSLSLRRLNGELLWQVDGWEIGEIKGVYDLLGNGDQEVVTVSSGWQPYANGAFMVIGGRDGKVLSRVDTWPDAGDIGHGDTKDHLHGSFSPLMSSSCVVADLDKDGKREIMVHPNYHSALMCFDFHDGLAKPKMMWKTRNRFRYDLYLYPLLAGDVDGDGWLEIVYHDNDLIRLFDGRTGEEKSAADMGCPWGLFGTMACGDVEGDGTAEVVLLPTFKPTYARNTVALAGWDGKALIRRWSRDFAEPVAARHFSAPLTSPFAEVDGDRKLEVTVQVGPDVLVLNGVDGTDKCCIPQATLSEAADLNGDGVTEIIVRKGGQTIIYNGKGEFAPKDVTYPANWGWHDWGDGDLCQLRSAANGQTEVVNQRGTVKATLPGAAYMTSPIVADLQGDGKMDVLVRDAGGTIRVLNPRALVESPGPTSRDDRRSTNLRPTGQPGWSGQETRPQPGPFFPELKCDLPGEFSRGGGITVCDLENDGKGELIFRQGGHLVVASSDGTIRFRSQAGGLNFPAVGEFDGDGIKDIACYAYQRWIAYSGKDGTVIWDSAAPESNEVATWDVDGDGLEDITGKMGPVFLLSGVHGHTMWTTSRREQCALGLGTFADLDGDGQMEIMATGEYTNTALYPDGKWLWWIGWSSGGNKEHYGAVADVNGDGAWDFAISSNHGVLYCVDGRDARELWTFKIREKVSLSHCAAADLDGDGKPEFVFGTNTGKLMIVNGEDGSLAKTVDFWYPVGEPIVADVNGDGLAEVLLVSNGILYCLAAQRARRQR